MSIELQHLKDQLHHTEGNEKFQLLIRIIEKMHYSPIEEADKIANQMLSLASELKDNRLMSKAYRAKCHIYGLLGKFDLYKETIHKALEVAKKTNDKKEISKSLTRREQLLCCFCESI